MLLLLSADFFKIKLFQKNHSGTQMECHGLDQDQDRHSLGPDLGPNCLQRLSADGSFSCFGCHLLTFLKNNFFFFFSKNLSGAHQSVKWFGS